MTSISRNVNAYDTGTSKPYKHDVSRGKWTSFQDFYCACMSHGFGVKHFSMLAIYAFRSGNAIFVVPYIFGMLFYAIPVFFIQSFLGQFSSSGFISAFRVAPLFKSLGYIILWLNICTACVYGILAAMPLVFFFSSFNPNLPWMSCDNSWNSVNCTAAVDTFQNDTYYYDIAWSSVEYFHHAVCQFDFDYEVRQYEISWRIATASILVWIIVGVIVLYGVELIGQILRYFTMFIGGVIFLLFLRLLFLPDIINLLTAFFSVHYFSPEILFASPMITVVAFGSGWGTIMTMSSYNNFREDIGRYSILICSSHMILLFMCALITTIVTAYLEEQHSFHIAFYLYEYYNLPYAVFPYFFGNLGWSNLWSILFFLAIFLGEISGLIILIFSTLTALFDEFLALRIYKREITILFITILMIVTLFAASNSGIFLIDHIFKVSGGLTTCVCFVELMMVVWIYGRVRLQRDVHFMLGKVYSTWRFYLLRFVTPCFIILLGLFNLVEVLMEFRHSFEKSVILAILIKFIPICALPIYIYWKLRYTIGNFWERFQKLCKPTDWYPVDPMDQRSYEDLINATIDSSVLINDMDLDGMIDETS